MIFKIQMMKNFTQKLCFIAFLFISVNAYCQLPKLNSLDTAKATIFLDFDGHTVQSIGWQSGTRFTCAPSSMNAAQVTEIFNRVSEYYRPFNINITTDSTKFLSAPPAKRIRIIITPTSGWYTGVGGISYTGSFTWGDDTPGFVFPDRLGNSPKYVAEACSHESGHSLGLSHQSRYSNTCTLLEPYSTGYGTGETGWAPVMGNSYGKNMTGWNDGPTPYDCSEIQDNLTIITSDNGFTYRTDDFNETLGSSTALLNATGFNTAGIISTATDKDAFKFVLTQRGNMHVTATPYNLGGTNDGANLDLKVMLYNSAKVLVSTYNPALQMGVTIDTTLSADTYYLVLTGTGNSNTSNYGSLGSYTLTGTSGALPIHDVALSGIAEKNKHKLSWSIIADEPIMTQQLEVSTNGINFSPLYTTGGTGNSYTYAPSKNGRFYYRLKVTSVIYESVYSNIVALTAANADEKKFTVSTLIQNEIAINASEAFTYVLSDMNGRTIETGKLLSGSSRINMSSRPKGMYIIQMLNDNYKQTERIIKQ
jgi:hypothetical protein